jgi:hypothetical protein
MPFATPQAANTRIEDLSTPLSEADIRDLLPWINALDNRGIARLTAELSLVQLTAMHEFDKNSTKLGYRMFWLTLVIGVLAACQVGVAILAIVMMRK